MGARGCNLGRRGDPRRPIVFCLTARPVVHYFAMETIRHILPFLQIIISALLIVSILLQRTGATLGGAFGADNFSSGFHTRRGFERTLFYASLIFAILFALSALVNVLIG